MKTRITGIYSGIKIFVRDNKIVTIQLQIFKKKNSFWVSNTEDLLRLCNIKLLHIHKD